MGVNHIAMWTRLLTLVNPLGVGHMTMWTMGVNHIQIWLLVLNHMAMWTNHITMWTIGVKSDDDANKIIDSSASGRLKELCPRGNNKVIIYFLISW